MATFYANLVKMKGESEKSLFEKNFKSTNRKIQSFFHREESLIVIDYGEKNPL